jgi:8-oxo-dGTP pyrophosphatase MutT (NUDIX family)
MGRKYKFFIKDKSVIFTQDSSFEQSIIPQTLFGKELEQLHFWINCFKEMSLSENQIVKVKNLDAFANDLMTQLPIIKAGGGFVLNAENQLLMIHRRGIWDLPKGKLDAGETIEQCATREVEEECGVSDLKITSDAFHTYHLYSERNGETVIKDSVWFMMKTSHQSALVPQTEEDIEQAIWENLPVSAEKMNGAYGSIQDVISHFQDLLLRVN